MSRKLTGDENDLSRKLKDIDIKIVELVSKTSVPRSTLYNYINLYSENKKESIDNKKIIELFDFVLNDSTVDRHQVFDYINDNFNYSDNIDIKNIKLLQKYFKLLVKASGWNLDELSEECGISVDRLIEIEEGNSHINEEESMALLISFCRESRSRDDNGDILTVALQLVFDEDKLETAEKQKCLDYVSMASDLKKNLKDDEFKEEFEKDFPKYTGKKIGKGIVIGAVAVAIGSILLGIIKKRK